MKKVTLLIALAALVMLAGCKKENDTKGVTLKASIEQNKGNGRTSLNPADGAISWTAGDKILVNNGSSNAIFTLTGGAGTTEGTFTYNGEYEFGTDNVAVYPETATINGNTVSFTLPEEQAFTAAGTFGNGANPMLGIFSDSEDLTFTSLCGGLGISLTGDNVDITGIEIVSNNTNDKLNGAFECTVEEPALVATLDNAGTNRIMLNCATTLTADPQDFFIVLPVGVLAEGFTLNVYNGGEEPIFTKSTESTELVVALNTVKTMNTVEVEVNIVPEGAINGLFTINANGDQVYFSKGNLQYIGSATTPYWKFADNQWDYLGTTTGQNSDDQNVDRDLFGWGTSGWNSGNTYFHPWDINNSDGSLYGPTGNSNLTGTNADADWGVYNPISNGGNISNQWRTLTETGWNYVFNSRSTITGIRYAKANVSGVDGLILLPDNWSDSIYSLSCTNQGNSSYLANVIGTLQWNILENAGAVFLPAAGGRNGESVYYTSGISEYHSCGYYWTATSTDDSGALFAFFYWDSVGTWYGLYFEKWHGYSVRLVRDAEY